MLCIILTFQMMCKRQELWVQLQLCVEEVGSIDPSHHWHVPYTLGAARSCKTVRRDNFIILSLTVLQLSPLPYFRFTVWHSRY